MKTLSLNGPWTLDIPGTDYLSVPAEVPGSVYHDLLAAGRIDDPFYRDNENRALPLMEHDFVYTRSFCVPEELSACPAVLLHFDGLDTLASVTLNGALLGSADNMHRVWEWDVKKFLVPGENHLLVRIDSPLRYIRKAYAEDPAEGSSDAMVGFPLLRKAHCMFGWDWGPRLPDAGIWRDVELIGIESARIGDVLILQHHENGRVTLDIRTNIEETADVPAEVSVRITSPDGKTYEARGASCRIDIDDPLLWWPSGFGDQPLYEVDVVLSESDRELDRWAKKIGLRTLTVARHKDTWGESFAHCVNGVEIFAMGADYIPEDNLLPRVTPERTRRLLEDAKAAHMNTIRVWGGGYYPEDFFFDLCDELGLLVWQDFMFACAVYNLTDDFEANIRAEFRDNIRRLRHHASLALWCGNNEMEDFVKQGQWVLNDRQRADYIKMYEYILPQVLKKEDPQRFYWPASPSSGGSFDYPQDPNRGDVHYWQVWHGLKPFTDYRNHFFRYVSEFGFQSFPCMETVASFTEPEDRNPFSYVMEKHQRNASANGRIVSYISQMYLYPRDLDTLIYASQLLQAQAMQYGVEHWRRNRGRCMGAVIWQLNDCWPVASWSSIDYYGRWKALHYYAKRFFAPLLLSCHEEGILSQNTNVNAEPFILKKSAKLNLSNETLYPFRGRARWALRRPNGTIIESGGEDLDVPPLSAQWLPEQEFPRIDPFDTVYTYALEDETGTVVSQGSVLFCPPKHFHFVDPCLTAEIHEDTILVRSCAYARSVEILCGADVVLEDNFFDMLPGTRRIRILRGKPETVSVRSVYDIR